jgi:phosphatidylglycerol---prolipoprotein diacylglyceryl transferase
VRVDSIPRHPGQLYEAIAYLVIFAVLFSLDRKTKRESGFIFGLFFVLLFSARFIIEFFKTNQSDFEANFIFNLGQLLSIPFILFGAIMIYRKRRKVSLSEFRPKSQIVTT